MKASMALMAGVAVLGWVGVLGGGCSMAPRGNSAGRIPVDVTTPGESPAHGIPLASLDEFASQVATQLANDLGSIPEVKSATGRVTIVFGDIVNETDMVPTRDFVAFRNKIRQYLQNTSFREKARFVESRDALASLRARERPAGAVTDTSVPVVNPRETYYLNGNFYRLARNQVSQYEMSFRLVNDFDATIVWENVPYPAKFHH
jgi:hypothetical protein